MTWKNNNTKKPLFIWKAVYTASKINFCQFLSCMRFCWTFTWSFLCRKLSGYRAANPWKTRVSAATLVIKKTIKCGKNFLSLGLLTPEIELDWLPGRLHYSHAKRTKRQKGPDFCRNPLPPLTLHNPWGPATREWNEQTCSRRDPISL